MFSSIDTDVFGINHAEKVRIYSISSEAKRNFCMIVFAPELFVITEALANYYEEIGTINCIFLPVLMSRLNRFSQSVI